MARLKVGARSNLKQVNAAMRVMGAPMADGRGQRVAAAIRRPIAEEFAGGFHYTRTGSRERWQPVPAFGTRPATVPPLGGPSGSLARAWAGGQGGYQKINPRSATIGVNLPFAEVHRGGARGQKRVTRIRAKKIGAKGLPAMWWFLGMTFGVWLNPDKLLADGVAVPSRPHATKNPRTVELVRDALLEEFREAA